MNNTHFLFWMLLVYGSAQIIRWFFWGLFTLVIPNAGAAAVLGR